MENQPDSDSSPQRDSQPRRGDSRNSSSSRGRHRSTGQGAAGKSNSGKSRRGNSRSDASRSKGSALNGASLLAIATTGVERGIQAIALLLVFCSPWYFGSVPWEAQIYLHTGALLLAACVGIYLLLALIAKTPIGRVPVPSLVLMLLALLAWYQTRPVYDWQNSDRVPPSVSMQRWALGLEKAPQAIEAQSIPIANLVKDSVPCDLQSIERNQLTASIEPLHTRGAISNLMLCALLGWVGATFFASKNSQLVLLTSLTAIGVAVACYGLLGAFSYTETNFLGLRTGSSFSTFRSKNTAGGFLNITIAAAIGLFSWTLIHLHRGKKDSRYRVADESTFSKIKGAVEDFFADLNTAQIAALVCLTLLVVSLVMSLCRGAVVAGVVATIAAAFIVSYKNRGRGGAVVSLLLIVVAVGSMIAFQVDENAYDRLQTLAEFDLTADSINGRSYIWGVAIEAMQYYGWLGSGVGTFHYAYLPFQDPSSPGWFYHAESLYLQCGVDCGWMGLLFLGIGIIACFVGIRTRLHGDVWRKGYPAKLAGSYLLISQCAHSAVDFALIFPALSISASLLWGSSIANLKLANLSSAKVRPVGTPGATPPPAPRSWLNWGAACFLVAMVLFLGTAIYPAMQSLAASDSLDRWVKAETLKAPEDRTPNRYKTLIERWPLGEAALIQNPTAIRLLAEASIFDFQRQQFSSAPANVNWRSAWASTDPLLLQIGLDRSKDLKAQESLIELAGGKAAVETLERASSLFAKGQTLAPLDWRLAWGRCLTALRCTREEMSRLISPVELLGRHVPAYMINSALLFRNQLTDTDRDRIWKQSMRTNPSASVTAAKNILAERAPEKIDLSIFPQRASILADLANSVFTKSKYPDLNRKLWEQSRKLFTGQNLSFVDRELWLADAARALEEPQVELEHLKAARRLSPTETKIGLRLTNALLEQRDISGASSIAEELYISDPADPAIQAIRKRIRAANLH